MELRQRATAQTPRFMLLLVAMFLEILLAPVILASPFGLSGARAITAVMLVAALGVIGGRRIGIAVFAVVALAHLLAWLRPETQWLALSSAGRLVFLSYVCGSVILHVFRERNVTYDTLAGAACGYMLLGLVWADLFILTQIVAPGSFAIPDSMGTGASHDPRAALVYFSFVTLTTVGYGDVHPNNPGAGGVAIAEAVIGQLYMAVMVARLVGLHLAGGER